MPRASPLNKSRRGWNPWILTAIAPLWCRIAMTACLSCLLGRAVPFPRVSVPILLPTSRYPNVLHCPQLLRVHCRLLIVPLCPHSLSSVILVPTALPSRPLANLFTFFPTPSMYLQLCCASSTPQGVCSAVPVVVRRKTFCFPFRCFFLVCCSTSLLWLLRVHHPRCRIHACPLLAPVFQCSVAL
jgi:hypothetical protein